MAMLKKTFMAAVACGSIAFAASAFAQAGGAAGGGAAGASAGGMAGASMRVPRQEQEPPERQVHSSATLFRQLKALPEQPPPASTLR